MGRSTRARWDGDLNGAALWALAALALAGCAMLKAPFSPPVERFPYSGDGVADTLVVLVASATDDAESMRKHDVVKQLRDAGCRCDVRIVYYTGPAYGLGTLVDSLHEEAAAPEEPYRQRVWVGFSAGALAALEVARKRPDDVTALVLVAPYLGGEKIVAEVERAGGLAQWNPHEPIEDIERMWQYVKGYANRDSHRPATFLLFGRDDMFAGAQRLMQQVMPESQVRVTDGKHDWPTFRALWREHLRSEPSWLLAEVRSRSR